MGNDAFLDEKIIEMINQVEQPVEAPPPDKVERRQDKRTIYTGIKIEGKRIEFEKRLLAKDKIRMMVPKEFMVMDAERAKIKYPSEQRPQTILTDYSGSINLLFNLMEQDTAEDEAEKVRDHLFKIMQRVNPGIKPLAMETEVVFGRNVAYVEFSNPAMDGKLYNLMFYLRVEGGILMGSFNCSSKVMKYWKQPAFEMMRSIEVLREEADGEEGELNGLSDQSI